MSAEMPGALNWKGKFGVTLEYTQHLTTVNIERLDEVEQLIAPFWNFVRVFCTSLNGNNTG